MIKRILLTLIILASLVASVLPATPAIAATYTLRPSANGDTIEQIPSAGQNWENVDEAVQDGDTTYNTQAAEPGWKRDLYNLPSPSAGLINNITVYMIAKSTSTALGQGKIIIKTGGTVYIGGQVFFLTSYGTNSTTWTNNPATGVAWTTTDIEALQIGTDVSCGYSSGFYYPIRVTQVYVVVDYTAIPPPTITSKAASNIAGTTARLNGTIDDDGGGVCEARWGYGKTSQTAGNFALYDTVTGWSGSYTTGQNPFYDASGLLPYIAPNDTPYYYRFQARNAEGTPITSGEITFNTTTGVDDPTNFQAFPQATSISLTWAKGTGSTNSMVRYGTSTYPTAIGEGTEVYFGTSSSATHSGLTAGETYYYSVWGESGGIYSTGYAYTMATTSAAGAEGEDLPSPSTPTRWLTAPDYTNLSNLPIAYDAINGTADSLGMPRETMWMILALIFAAGFGIAVYIVSGHKMLVGIIAMVIALVAGWAIEIVPFWIPLLSIILVVSLKVSHREVEY